MRIGIGPANLRGVRPIGGRLALAALRSEVMRISGRVPTRHISGFGTNVLSSLIACECNHEQEFGLVCRGTGARKASIPLSLEGFSSEKWQDPQLIAKIIVRNHHCSQLAVTIIYFVF